MYVHLELGWLHHPFPVNNFKVVSQAQLQSLQELGLGTVQYDPDKSDVAPEVVSGDDSSGSQPQAVSSSAQRTGYVSGQAVEQWHAKVKSMNLLFLQKVQQFEQIEQVVHQDPQAARISSEGLISNCLAALLPEQDVVLHVLSDSSFNAASAHGVNVTVLCLLLGRAMGLDADVLDELGLAALLHDVGKLVVPAQPLVCGMNIGVLDVSNAQHMHYASHVGESVAVAQNMGLSTLVTSAIAQHHEWADGSGFPLHLLDSDMELAGQILCVVNAYDRLCNPPGKHISPTPHEALASMFTTYQAKFAPLVLAAFVRLMGVYPPGSLVEMVDGRQGLVTSVNTAYPLKPLVLLYDVMQTGSLLLVDLLSSPQLGIRRGLKLQQLTRESVEALLPHRRVSYYFESIAGVRLEKALS